MQQPSIEDLANPATFQEWLQFHNRLGKLLAHADTSVFVMFVDPEEEKSGCIYEYADPDEEILERLRQSRPWGDVEVWILNRAEARDYICPIRQDDETIIASFKGKVTRSQLKSVLCARCDVSVETNDVDFVKCRHKLPKLDRPGAIRIKSASLYDEYPI